MGLLFTMPDLEVLETSLNNILMMNNEIELLEDAFLSVDEFYILESNF